MLLTKFKGPNDKPTLRPYTPVSDEDTRGHMDLIVKRYEGGPMSSHIHDLKIDETLDFKGPFMKYEWTPNKHDQVTLVAGGTGIFHPLQGMGLSTWVWVETDMTA